MADTASLFTTETHVVRLTVDQAVNGDDEPAKLEDDVIIFNQ